MLVLLLIWAMGIYSMYLRSYFLMQRQDNKVVIGEHQAVLQLVSAMQSQLSEHTDEGASSAVFVLTEEQIRQRIAKDLKGGSISVRANPILDSGSEPDSDDTRHAPSCLRTWLRSEIFWLIAVLVFFIGAIFSVVFTEMYILTLLLPFEIPFAMYIGQSKRSRWMILFYLIWFYCSRAVIPIFITQINSARDGYELVTVTRGRVPDSMYGF